MKRIYINEQVCMGCHLCEVYCRVQHSKSGDLIKAFNKESPPVISRVHIEEKRPVSFSLRCLQCPEPACVDACLTGAMHLDKASGLVVHDEDKCIGCWTCILACPYGAIRQDKERSRIVKCDLCSGRDIPICVQNCPNEALTYK